MKRRITHLLVAASAVLFVVPAAFPEAAYASVSDQRREVERVVDELDRLHSQADILAEDWAEAEDDLRRLDQEVIEAEARVAAKEAELNLLRGDLSEMAVRAFTGAGGDVLGPLFSNADEYGDTLSREQFSRVALSVGTTTTDDLDEFVADLDAERDDLANKREQVAALKVTIEQKRTQTEELTAQFVERRAEAEARLGQLIQEEEERRDAEAFARLQAELEAEQAAAAAAQSNNDGGGDDVDTDSGGGDGGDSGGGAPTPAPSSGGGGGDGDGDGDGDGGAPTKTPAPAPEPVSAPAVSGLAGIVVQAAMAQQGVRYVYATSKPGVSFDCSGLTHYAWGQAGIYLPRNSRAQAAATPRVAPAAAEPGDLIFYYSPISHVGIYIGGGQLVHAPNSGTVVKVANVSWGKVTAVSRPG
jgi:cell wall-associated NlpC family hydrolase/cell division protein FtsB